MNSIYRTNVQEEDPEDADATMDRLSRTKRFDGFKDAANAEAREGPVQFEKDKVIVGSVPGKEEDDPFNIGQMINEVTNPATKRFGIQQGGRDSKRARVDSDED
jgi:SNW domain-containing protein 1